MTSKVNGKTEILIPCRSETPENIEAKIETNDFIIIIIIIIIIITNR